MSDPLSSYHFENVYDEWLSNAYPIYGDDRHYLPTADELALRDESEPPTPVEKPVETAVPSYLPGQLTFDWESA